MNIYAIKVKDIDDTFQVCADEVKYNDVEYFYIEAADVYEAFKDFLKGVRHE